MKKTILAVMFAGSVLTAQASNVMNDSSKNIGEMVSDSLFENPIGMVSQHPVGDLLEIRFVVVSMNIINLTVAKDILIYMIIHGGNVFVLLRVPKEKTIHKVVRQFGAGLNIFGMLLRIIIIILMQKQTQSRLI